MLGHHQQSKNFRYFGKINCASFGVLFEINRKGYHFINYIILNGLKSNSDKSNEFKQIARAQRECNFLTKFDFSEMLKF